MAFRIIKLTATLHTLAYHVFWNGSDSNATIIPNATLFADAIQGPLRTVLARTGLDQAAVDRLYAGNPVDLIARDSGSLAAPFRFGFLVGANQDGPDGGTGKVKLDIAFNGTVPGFHQGFITLRFVHSIVR